MSETKSLENLRVSPLSIVGFILGFGFITAPIGLALSSVALSEIKNNQTTLRGAGLAKWGIALSLTSVCWLGICGASYKHNLWVYRGNLEADEVVIAANRAGKNPGALSENLASYEHKRNNPPSFFNPFSN